jgi:hypothetical protein
MTAPYYEDADTVDELLYNFAVDQYDEFAAVEDGTTAIIDEDPLWHRISDGEQRVLTLTDQTFTGAMDRYADRWMELQNEYNWARRSQEEILEKLPKDGVYSRGEPLISQGRMLPPTSFRSYLENHHDVIQQATTPTDLEERLDGSTTAEMVRQNGSKWYIGLWDAMHIGDPPVREQLGNRPDNDGPLLDRAATAMTALDRMTTAVLEESLNYNDSTDVPEHAS